MKKVILSVFTVMFIFGTALAAGNNEQYFTVEADAIVKAKPDKVILNVGVITKGKDLKDTKKRNSDIIKNAIEYCKKASIQEKHIQTDYLNLRPEFRNYETYETNFIIEQNLSVTLEDISKYDEVLTELINLGMNRVNGVDFQVSDLKKYRNESRKLAIAAAKERAELLAQEAGIKLGGIINVSDRSSNWFPFARASAMTANASQNMMLDGGFSSGSDVQDTLALGMVSIRSNIILTYEIK